MVRSCAASIAFIATASAVHQGRDEDMTLLQSHHGQRVETNGTSRGNELEPPDLRGKWSLIPFGPGSNEFSGCVDYTAITGTDHFPAGKATCYGLPTSGLTTTIFQDCRELTIVGDALQFKCGDDYVPMHHSILDGKYVTEDWTNSGVPLEWTSSVENPDNVEDTDAETGATVVVFDISSLGGTPGKHGKVKRYIDKDGNLVWKLKARDPSTGKEATFTTRFKKEVSVPAQSDPAVKCPKSNSCGNRKYSDGQGAAGWTPACCEANPDYGRFAPNPNRRYCDFEPNDPALQCSVLSRQLVRERHAYFKITQGNANKFLSNPLAQRALDQCMTAPELLNCYACAQLACRNLQAKMITGETCKDACKHPLLAGCKECT